nr:putative ribonuclease H-like domain-containing protein [Tanacetum cinerariifolium]
FVHIPKTNRSKLDPCSERCVFVGYGATQKGYRCYNPKTKHMFTTMNCDFLETEYYYASQHTGQGETEYTNSQDTLSWLSHATRGEERNHGPQNGTPLPTQPENLSVTVSETAPDLIPEVSNSNTNSETGSFFETPDHTGQSENTHEQEMEAVEIVSKGYVLSPRSNWGVPPKRYSPEKESRRCKYPVANIAEGNLSKGAKAFISSLYSNEVPTTIEQALK